MAEMDPTRLPGFQCVSIQDRAVLEPVLLNSGRKSCEFNFTNLFAWGDMYRSSWSIVDGILYLLLETDDLLMFASGGTRGPSLEQLLRISDLAREHGYGGSFYHVDDAYLEAHPEVEKEFRIEPMSDAFAEYVYDVDALVGLHGAKLHKKKNLIAQFRKAWPQAKTERVGESNLADCQALAERWRMAQPDPDALEIRHEAEAIARAVRHYSELPLEGVALRVDGTLIGFSMCSPIGPDIWTEHFEKADASWKGAAQVLNWETAKALQGRVKTLNREQDLGLEGLRRAKESYAPLYLLKNSLLIRK